VKNTINPIFIWDNSHFGYEYVISNYNGFLIYQNFKIVRDCVLC